MKQVPNYLGRVYVLWGRTYEFAATVDGAGRPHDGYVVQEEHVVTVTGQALRTDPHSGEILELTATTADGQAFELSGGEWHRKDTERTPHVEYVDALKASEEHHRFGMNVCLDEQGNTKVPVGAELCRYHGNYFLPAQGCSECEFDREVELKNGQEGPLHYVPCPFCDQYRLASRLEAQHYHVLWVHRRDLALRRIAFDRQHKRGFDFYAEVMSRIAAA